MNPQEKRILIRLISNLRDKGELETHESETLNVLLSKHKEARELYYEMIDMEHELESVRHFATTSPTNHAGNLSKILQFPILKIAASLVFGLFLTYFYFGYVSEKSDLSDSPTATNHQWVGVLQQNPESNIIYNGKSQRQKPDLYVGNYSLTHGSIRMEFFEGASIQADAPCKFQILSPNHINVSEGTMGAKVFDKRSGFKISNHNSMYIDLGTKFSVSFDNDGGSDLHVFEGEVLASSLNTNGDSERVRLVKKNESLGIDPTSTFRTQETKTLRSKVAVEYTPVVAEALEVSQDYADAVLRSQPSAYWRLNQSFENEVSEGVSLSLSPIGNGLSFIDSTSGINSYINLPQSSVFNALKINERITLERNAEFSVELWAVADKFNRSTLFGLYDAEGVLETGETNHVAIIDFMHKPRSFHHVPSAIRTAYRPIASDDYYSGINMFTKFHYRPGKWYHIVLVKTEQSIETYVDGERTSQVMLSAEDHLAGGHYAAVFGQMSLQNWETAYESQKRPFSGGIDEIAIYHRALSATEVTAHYRSLNR